MLPSILAHELQESIRRFLITGFEPADRYFAGIVRRFVDQPAALSKGPYLQVGLPFRMGTSGRTFFTGFETKNQGFAHQEAAWARLRSDLAPGNTLVVTGTGSGKTECFLYPVLAHCARVHPEQPRGVKALVIYPMNALANDQARRFAETIATTTAFARLRVGLYVGGKSDTSPVMTPTSVITDRDVLRQAPPDVLLTNYKMLDYLLVRPKDRGLWTENAPDTLRYVVVDELHTFDGAQGTDLALLLRRVRARLGTPADQIICVGTSATLGDGNSGPLRIYAREIFASPFEPDSVITEARDTVAQFLGDEPINHLLQSRDDFGEVLDPQRYTTPEAAIAAWFPVFFAGEPSPDNVTTPEWRSTLGRLLKQHLLVHNLLRLLKGGIGEWATLQEQLAGPLPTAARPHALRVLDSLVALLAWARDPKDPRLPLVTVRVQVWMRELRRLVSTVVPVADGEDGGNGSERPILRAAADLRATAERLHLPLVQCIECHTTGWLALKPNTATRVESSLEAIYNAWFRWSPDLVRIYGDTTLGLPVRKHLCGACGNLQDSSGPCAYCGHATLTPVGLVMDSTVGQVNGVNYRWHDKTCPACGARDRFLLLGARAATLGAQVIEHSWATPYNDDKKLIAFSDSVQDAAHRAGFFGSRTYRNNVRMAITRAVAAMAAPTVPWLAFQKGLAAWLLDPLREGRFTPEAFVAEFIGPDMTGLRGWSRLRENGGPVDGRLLERVQKRLAWEAFAEFTYVSRRGRTLDRLGLATLTLPPDALDVVVGPLHRRLVEAFGLRDVLQQHVLQWLWGLILHLKQRGAVTHDEMTEYAQTGALGRLTFAKERKLWLPPIGPATARPQWLSLGRHRDFDSLLNKGRSWYEQWLVAGLGRDGALLPQNGAEDIYGAAISTLLDAGVLTAVDGLQGRAVALAAERLVVDPDTVVLAGPRGGRHMTVARALARVVLGMPCLDAIRETYAHAIEPADAEAWVARRYRTGDVKRVIAAEHTGLLERDDREALEHRFKATGTDAKPWYENLLSATPTLEMGVDIGSLSSLLLCSVPPSQASYLQRVGRAGRRDGNALVTTIADGTSPHDLYFYEDPLEMMAGQVTPPGTFLQAPEVLRRQMLAFCLDAWVATGVPATAFPDKTKPVLDAVERNDQQRFPYTFLDFVKLDEGGLLDRFVALLDYRPVDEAERRSVARVLERLRAFMLGGDEVDSLRVSLLNTLLQLIKERQSYLTRAKAIKTEFERLKKQPVDEARDAQLKAYYRERAKALELARDIGDRDVLNTFTDAGLLPNYAFPEAGVELKSILWRHRRDDDDPGEKAIVTTTERFERPAASALSEFAPENRFYANQRRVQIDQINMQLADTEEWRLCPSCHHLENLAKAGGDLHPACPRCGTAMWSDVQQKRTLLRFKQAIANANADKSRIDDRSDDREPRFFVRQLLVDVDPANVTVAWKLQNEHLAFGFESIRRADFRDINFGEVGRPGAVTFPVADRNSPRPGFKVCRKCGMVQGNLRRRAGQPQGPVYKHTRDCQWFGNDTDEPILDCLYLYREFASEAVRILVPYTRTGINEVVLQSFMAALQLGLKRHYGGRVDHLRITTQEEPGTGGGPKRHYVLLYDSVPGGTGYLQQLLTEDAETLTKVLRKAHDALRTCSCVAQAEKDGCYRCLYQYRQARALPNVSRRAAEGLLSEMLKGLDKLERVTSISAIAINPQIDSVLEGNFIESLTRLSGVSGLPRVRATQDIHQGRTAWLLEVGQERYWVRPQVDLGREDSVVAQVRPDFLIEPVRRAPDRRAIAVFADGWLYHRDVVRADARKRSALVASGKYWVWSVVWEDVQAALGGQVDRVLDAMGNHARHASLASVVANIRARHAGAAADVTEHAVARLIRWLTPSPPDESAEAWLRRRRSDAVVMSSRLLVVPDPADRASAAEAREGLAAALPDGLADVPSRTETAWSANGNGVAMVLLAWPRRYTEGEYDAGYGAVVLAPEVAREPEELRMAWREWLGLFNELQVLPNTFLMTRDGIAHGDYVGLCPSQIAMSAEFTGGAQADASWQARIGEAIEDVRDGLRSLAARGAPPPDAAGVELEHHGVVQAEAELQWSEDRLVLLAAHQLEGAALWTEAGWQVVPVSDADWVRKLAETLSRGREA
jgi:DEAD/DEAH box helicase domain-containing protein